jgi:hypothetical protein
MGQTGPQAGYQLGKFLQNFSFRENFPGKGFFPKIRAIPKSLFFPLITKQPDYGVYQPAIISIQ